MPVKYSRLEFAAVCVGAMEQVIRPASGNGESPWVFSFKWINLKDTSGRFVLLYDRQSQFKLEDFAKVGTSEVARGNLWPD